MSDIQPVFEQKPEEKDVWAFLSYSCAQLQKGVSNSKPLNNVPISRIRCEPEKPQCKRKREVLGWMFCNVNAELTTLGSGEEPRGPEQAGKCREMQAGKTRQGLSAWSRGSKLSKIHFFAVLRIFSRIRPTQNPINMILEMQPRGK